MRYGYVCGWVLAIAVSASAAQWSGVLLNEMAVTDESGAILVLGTPGSFQDKEGIAKEAVFDGRVSSYYDPKNNGIQNWAGIELPEPKIVTRVRFYGRPNWSSRLSGVLFQGANDPDFSDAVTLCVAEIPTVYNGNYWLEQYVDGPVGLQAFKYLRVIGPSTREGAGYACGNIAELEFYGLDELPMTASEPDPPTFDLALLINGTFNYVITCAEADAYYEVQVKESDREDFTTVSTPHALNTGTALSVCIADYTFHTATEVRYRAVNASGASEWQTFGTVSVHPYLSGSWIGLAGAYTANNTPSISNSMTGDKAFDGNVFTYYDATNGQSTAWTGLDFGTKRTLSSIRWVARQNQGGRMNGAYFQIADNPDFANPTTIYTIFGSQSETSVTAVSLPEPVTTRYVRYVGAYGNVADIEFSSELAETDAADVMADFDVVSGTASVTWLGVPANVHSAIVSRAVSSPYGPFRPVGVLGYGETSFADTDALRVGTPHYYQMTPVMEDEIGRPVVGEPFTPVGKILPCMRVDRDPADLSKLRDGVSVIYTQSAGTWGTDTVYKVFDGDESTFGDVYRMEKGGLDLGEPWHICLIRALPRLDGNVGLTRVNQSQLFGSNSIGWSDTFDELTAPMPFSAKEWHIFATTNTAPYRYVFLWKYTASEGFHLNYAEVELYGWRDSDVTVPPLTPPVITGLDYDDTALTLTWEGGENADTYTVMRSVDGGAWQPLAEGVTATSFTDYAIAYNGTRYGYRVDAVRDDETVYSAAREVMPYHHGNGTGLYAVYAAPFSYRGTEVPEKPVLTRVEAFPSLDWGNGEIIPGITNNLSVTWNGKLIVPFDGTYTFSANVDDALCLRIDGADVINQWTYTSAQPLHADVALTAGEHDLRAYYHEDGGNARFLFSWGGRIPTEPITASQLIPVPYALADEVPAGWSGARTFGQPYMGRITYDAKTRSYALTGGGLDFHGSSEGHVFLWRTFKGSFDLWAKVEYIAPRSGCKAILMAKNSLAPGQPVFAASTLAYGGEGSTIRFGSKIRKNEGDSIRDLVGWLEETTIPMGPFYMRLTRQGNCFTQFYRNLESDPWIEVCSFTDEEGTFAEQMHVGLAITGDTASSAVNGCRFSEVHLTPFFVATQVILR